MSKMNQPQEVKKVCVRRRVCNVIGIILCILLLPILVINCFLIIKGMVKKDEVPSIAGYTPLIVLTDSMDPTIQAGDLIFCKNANAEKVVEGDVISFFDPDTNRSSVVTHRVIKIEMDEESNTLYLYTKGDNNNIADRTPVPADHVIGIWTGTRIGKLGRVVLFMQSTLGLILCIFIPVSIVVIYEIVRKKQKDKAKQKDMEALVAELNELKALQSQQKTENVSAESDTKGV